MTESRISKSTVENRLYQDRLKAKSPLKAVTNSSPQALTINVRHKSEIIYRSCLVTLGIVPLRSGRIVYLCEDNAPQSRAVLLPCVDFCTHCLLGYCTCVLTYVSVFGSIANSASRISLIDISNTRGGKALDIVVCVKRGGLFPLATLLPCWTSVDKKMGVYNLRLIVLVTMTI